MIESNDTETIEYYIGKTGVSVVLFRSTLCNSCVTVAKELKVIEEAGEFPIYCVNIYKNKDLAAKYSIEKVPTVIIFVNGRIKSILVGSNNKFEYLSEIKKALVI
jgi:thioredoxin-like negative regulator of GroEL